MKLTFFKCFYYTHEQLNREPRKENHSKTVSPSESIFSLSDNGLCRHPNSAGMTVPGNMPVYPVTHNATIKNNPAAKHIENSHKDVEVKLEAMENYLDGFYTKVKSDVRVIKKLIQDERTGS